MVTQEINLTNKIFETDYTISSEKIDKAIDMAIAKIERNISHFVDKYPVVEYGENKIQKTKYAGKEFWGKPSGEWLSGLYEGMYWLCWELTGNQNFFDAANRWLPYFIDREQKKHDMFCHDTGFVFSPSLVAAYKLTGNKEAYIAALDAAQYFYDHNYCKEGGFILRCDDGVRGVEGSCRTMMDTMLNIPLLFWAGKETGEQKYIDAANAQCEITNRCLLRADGSSYHHYQFDTKTFEPKFGLTYQGRCDESTWSRGHSWGIMGYPIAYAYTGNKEYIDIHKDITYYFLNHLQSDFLPNWDFDYTSDCDQRDSSAAAISVCGMLEMIRHLPDTASQKSIFKNASARILESLIDNCTKYSEDFDGLICKVWTGRGGEITENTPKDIFAVYGDYSYLEALMRYKNANWKMYW